jgi:inosine/xanthosine triphosphatase
VSAPCSRDPVGAPLAGLELVRAGSTNPPKLEGIRAALAAFTPGVRVLGVDVPSGVPEQPVGFEEIVEGARGRAREAARSGACELAVGYEDGLVEVPVHGGGFFNVGCAAVRRGDATWIGFSSGFAYPESCTRPAVAERAPIGGVFDALWRTRRGDARTAPSALSVGNVGKLSAGALTRAEYTRHAVLCALVPLLHPDLYGARPGGAGVRP